ncbi:hypothetical protein UY3_10965 [Chelonia mydas]|uniref:Uncharacterized protein n=1 Tax=Chelonia mydas TaxID=8469 RepID=M7BUX7_CHEMY|nr:hypothetical protein UY3_10965 [Chelonia mydas]
MVPGQGPLYPFDRYVHESYQTSPTRHLLDLLEYKKEDIDLNPQLLTEISSSLDEAVKSSSPSLLDDYG